MAVPSPNISTRAQEIVMSLAQGRQCSCGHGVSHIMVGPEADYRILDRFAMSIIACRVCEGVLVETKHPVVLESFH